MILSIYSPFFTMFTLIQCTCLELAFRVFHLFLCLRVPPLPIVLIHLPHVQVLVTPLPRLFWITVSLLT
jgi:hypothetical protein